MNLSSLAIFLGIDTHNGAHGKINIYGHATKARRELNIVVVHLKTADGSGGYIENNLAIGDKILGHFYLRIMGIDHDVGSTIVIHYPVIEGFKQIGSIGPHIHLSSSGANFALKISETFLEGRTLEQAIHILQQGLNLTVVGQLDTQLGQTP